MQQGCGGVRDEFDSQNCHGGVDADSQGFGVGRPLNLHIYGAAGGEDNWPNQVQARLGLGFKSVGSL